MVYQVQSKSDLEDKLKEAGNKLVVLDFYATWCGPCKLISPKIEDMSKQYSDVVFMKVDVDECEDVAMDYEVSCMPTFIFVKQGNKVAEFSGANEEKLRELVEANK